MAQSSGRKLLIEAITHIKDGYHQVKPTSASAVTTITSSPIYARTKDKVSNLMTVYEEVIGLKQVKEAQQRVLEAELNFKECQKQRRLVQDELTQVQNQLRTLRIDIDRTARGDFRYLDLIKGEIELINSERAVRSHFEQLEENEREVFSELSNALRLSHEKERYQSEKTKYWSVWGSVIGACLGIIGTTINSRLRYQATRDILLQTNAQVKDIENSVQSLIQKLELDRNAPQPDKIETILSSSTLMEEKLVELKEAIRIVNNLSQNRQGPIVLGLGNEQTLALTAGITVLICVLISKFL